MERLTKRINGEACHNDCSGTCDGCECFDIGAMVDRLTAYEDTGIPPEVCAEYKKFEDELVKGGIPFGHVIDLLVAEKDGRLWISPIPLVEGTKLFCPRKDDVQEQTVQYITLLDGEPSIAVSFDCDYECNGCPHRAPYTNYEAGDGGCDGEGGYGLLLLSQIGKTVFLTRAEAEAALGKERGNETDSF